MSLMPKIPFQKIQSLNNQALSKYNAISGEYGRARGHPFFYVFIALFLIGVFIVLFGGFLATIGIVLVIMGVITPIHWEYRILFFIGGVAMIFIGL